VRAVNERARVWLAEALGGPVLDVRSLGGQHGVDHYRLTLPDGRAAFAKLTRRVAGAGASGSAGAVGWPGSAGFGSGSAGFEAEAAGLRWLGGAAEVPVPAVLAANDSALIIEWVAEDRASPQAAVRFGADLAGLHAAGAEQFGAPWPGVIAGLPLPNDQAADWPGWYATRRLLPYARLARDSGAFSAADAELVESVAGRIADLAGPAEPPSRIHGDCWSGNVLWSGGRGWLIDPAAHGGHRETDLAMLALFGGPHLDSILASYQDVRPLAAGWRDRIPLHQLHPLLVHVCLFGASYREAALAAARDALRVS
jgi:fructosamine-3-kinase